MYKGAIAEKGEWGTGEDAEFVCWDTQISAHATVLLAGIIGTTLRIVISKGRMVYRDFDVHRRVMVGIDNPTHRTEIAGVHAIETLHDWIEEPKDALCGVANAFVHAGGN